MPHVDNIRYRNGLTRERIEDIVVSGKLVSEGIGGWLPSAAGWLLGIHPNRFTINRLEAPSGPVETLLPSGGLIVSSGGAGPRFNISNLLKWLQLRDGDWGGGGTFDASIHPRIARFGGNPRWMGSTNCVFGNRGVGRKEVRRKRT